MLWIEMEADYEKYYQNIKTNENIKLYEAIFENYYYHTIFTTYFKNDDDILKISLENVFKKVLNKYLKIKNINKKDKILIVGLGNKNINADALGPLTIENLIVTNNNFNNKFRPICALIPDVTINTGMDSAYIIKSIVKQEKPKFVIIIDSLKANTLKRMNSIIQFTDKGVSPGSGIYDNRIEINENFLKTKLLVIGIPTVVDIKSILKDYTKENFFIDENIIVSSKNIDYEIKLMSRFIAKCLNDVLIFNKK